MPWRSTRARSAPANSNRLSKTFTIEQWPPLRSKISLWGIIPAAGSGTRIQPLAFSKELLPVGGRVDGAVERPRAISEYLVDRMIIGGAHKLCFVIAPGKSDILEYYGGGKLDSVTISFVMQPHPNGLCDAIFQAAPLVAPDEAVCIGLPDTIWFPENALCALPEDKLSFLLFPVAQPQFFDAVRTTDEGRVIEIQVKQQDASSNWIWGAFKMPGAILHELHALWLKRNRQDEYIGTLVNAWVAHGGDAVGIRAGESYVDVGTLHGYRQAMNLLARESAAGAWERAAPKYGQPQPAVS